MHAYFDSPETIRNKVKEFKTATFNGLNKQDVMNYLSQLSEQQGVMIRLLRENNIPLFVDDGYTQEEQFEKPIDANQDYLSQYLGGSNADIVAEMQAEIEALKAENNELKMLSNNTTSSNSTDNGFVTDFDASFGLNDNSNNKTAELEAMLEEKDMYIKELESALNDSPANNTFNLVGNSDNALEDTSLGSLEKQAYEEEILSLRNEIENLQSQIEATSSNQSDFNLFEENITPNMNEDLKASYEEEIATLKAQLEEALSSSNEVDLLNIESTNLDEDLKASYEQEIEELKCKLEEALSTSNEPVDSSVDNNVEIEELKSTIDTLNSTISDLQSELDTCHELLDECSNNQIICNNDIVTNDEESNNSIISLDSSEEESEEDLIESLKTTIEVLEIEVSKKDKEKANIAFQLEELNAELSKYTNYKDENGNLVSIDMESLVSKHNELLSLESKVAFERNEIDKKIASLQEKEALIEANKHLISEDYVQNILAKEQEIDRLRRQMDKMLTVAQATADSTEQEATAKANQMLENAKNQADSIVAEASEKSTQLIDEANTTLATANEFKSTTEKEMEDFREETRKNAEEILLDAQNKATQVLEEAQLEAQKTQDAAIEEINRITAEAENKVAEIDSIIKSKEKEIDNLQKYYLKVKNDGLVGVKKLYNQLENIIYSDELS